VPYADAEVKRAKQRDHARAKRARLRAERDDAPPGGESPVVPSDPLPPVSLRCPADCLSLLETEVAAVRAGVTGATVRARILIYAAAVALHAIECGDHADRIAKLEEAEAARRPAAAVLATNGRATCRTG
jgi:hypothetical protein